MCTHVIVINNITAIAYIKLLIRQRKLLKFNHKLLNCPPKSYKYTHILVFLCLYLFMHYSMNTLHITCFHVQANTIFYSYILF